MGTETERKFLVEGIEYREQATRVVPITQGYLNSHPARTVRVRLEDGVGVLTIKGPKDPSGVTGKEYNLELSAQDAIEILELSEHTPIDKTRHCVPYEGHTFEVDEFHGRHAGKVIAEVELEDPHEHVEIPHWVGREVTGQRQYYNAVMSQPADPILYEASLAEVVMLILREAVNIPDGLYARAKYLAEQDLTFRKALEDIVDPIGKMKRELKDGEQLNGMFAVQMAESAHYLQSIATDALGKK